MPSVGLLIFLAGVIVGVTGIWIVSQMRESEESKSEPDDWSEEVEIPESKFEQLRSNETFKAVLVLARLVNSVRFSQMAPYEAVANPGPNANRQVINGFLFQTASLFEALERARTMGRGLKSLPGHGKLMVPFLRRADVQALERGSLKTLRDKVAFHFDLDVFEEAIKDIHLPRYVFLQQAGPARKDVYYPLADEIVLHYLKGDEGLDRSEHLKMVDQWLQTVTDISHEFIQISELLLVEGVESLGLRGSVP